MFLKLTFPFLLSVALLSVSCSSTKDLPTKSEFPFEFRSEQFQIISISAPSGEGMNMLVKNDQQERIFKSVDQDQDGKIDIVQYGSFSVDEANLIYTYGIQQAIAENKFKARRAQRIFTFIEDSVEYSIQTFGFYRDLLYNEFTILNLETGTKEIFLDLDANGKLDTVEESERSIEDIQQIYRMVLTSGQQKNLIEYKFEKFVVLVNPDNQAS